MVATTIKVVPRNRINKEISKRVNSPVKYWEDFNDALDLISEIMYEHNFQIKEGQLTEKDGSYCLTHDIEAIYGETPMSIRNSMLVFMFYQMASGRYEVIAYLS